VKTEVTTSLEKTDEASLTEKVKLSLVLAKTETKSENGKYYDKKSSTWINVWLLLSIASWKVYLQEQEKYRWRVREFDSRIQEAKPKGSVIHSVRDYKAEDRRIQRYKAFTHWRGVQLIQSSFCFVFRGRCDAAGIRTRLLSNLSRKLNCISGTPKLIISIGSITSQSIISSGCLLLTSMISLVD